MIYGCITYHSKAQGFKTTLDFSRPCGPPGGSSRCRWFALRCRCGSGAGLGGLGSSVHGGAPAPRVCGSASVHTPPARPLLAHVLPRAPRAPRGLCPAGQLGRPHSTVAGFRERRWEALGLPQQGHSDASAAFHQPPEGQGQHGCSGRGSCFHLWVRAVSETLWPCPQTCCPGGKTGK